MSDTFTIKFKGVLDHAETKKALEKDISKMEKYLKPARTSLGSTKDIIKSNLSDKKRELSKQKKYEALREKTEKFKLAETKKLMSQGKSFAKARKEAFRRSQMSDDDLRKLEYKKLKKDEHSARFKKGFGFVTKVAMGTAIGNVVSGALNKGVSGVMDFAKKSVEMRSQIARQARLSSKMFTTAERSSIEGMLKGRGFEKQLDKEDFITKSALIKSELKQLGITDQKSIVDAVQTAVDIKKSGLLGEGTDESISAVVELLKGNAGVLFDTMHRLEGIGDKYNDFQARNFENVAKYDVLARLATLREIKKDVTSADLSGYATVADKSEGSMTRIEDNLGKLTSRLLEPAIKLVDKLLVWIENFSIEKSIISPIKNIFSIDTLIARLKSILPSWMGGDSGASLGELNKRREASEDGSSKQP
ncbi:hypothetical protein CR532_05265 (plasmid) [Candidatus Borreliella tachyglossi]|uniref:Uncharacterized protein n=1 Tax=Candidatus Borreliella tachyglossi TaxID=1964448 RepID=A0A2S1LYT3_9SPIR|nr:DUF759 family protein [Candidatus Borreliella tachyglossi]AWG43352.1 hypothetical protein CR532_04965 [Candidatus Borreliella tachyglossi]AWG43405.1 hypothetical protein CR532_05265 [Candidatus Borreliella tachyglossi]